jgi:triosephosphate isomerase (TIM)
MKYIIGNWKMHGSRDMAWKLGLDLHQFLTAQGRADAADAIMVICPPFPYLPLIQDFLSRHQSPLGLGAQDCHGKTQGAFTGDISAAMLADIGCAYVILGHSERRQYHAETDTQIAEKIQTAQAAGLTAILCIGETMAERQAGQTENVLSLQLNGCLAPLPDAAKLIIAYEPVWAIGTGLNANADDIQAAHRHIRQELMRHFGPGGGKIPVVYGGSVKPSNAKATLATPGVDGALIGGASLTFQDFRDIYLSLSPSILP